MTSAIAGGKIGGAKTGGPARIPGLIMPAAVVNSVAIVATRDVAHVIEQGRERLAGDTLALSVGRRLEYRRAHMIGNIARIESHIARSLVGDIRWRCFSRQPREKSLWRRLRPLLPRAPSGFFGDVARGGSARAISVTALFRGSFLVALAVSVVLTFLAVFAIVRGAVRAWPPGDLWRCRRPRFFAPDRRVCANRSPIRLPHLHHTSKHRACVSSHGRRRPSIAPLLRRNRAPESFLCASTHRRIASKGTNT